MTIWAIGRAASSGLGFLRAHPCPTLGCLVLVACTSGSLRLRGGPPLRTRARFPSPVRSTLSYSRAGKHETSVQPREGCCALSHDPALGCLRVLSSPLPRPRAQLLASHVILLPPYVLAGGTRCAHRRVPGRMYWCDCFTARTIWDFSDFGFRIDVDLLPKLDSVPRSIALICLSQSREGRQALQDRYSWLQKVN